MNIIKIVAKNIPTFEEVLEIDFTTQQRVSARDEGFVHRIQGSVYLNHVLAFTGINASGKTSVLKLIMFVIDILNNKSLGTSLYAEVIRRANADIGLEIYFSTDDYELHKLEMTISSENRNVIGDIVSDAECKLMIKAERLYSKPLSKTKTRAQLVDYSGIEPMMVRDKGIQKFLLDDVSIIVSFNMTPEGNRMEPIKFQYMGSNLDQSMDFRETPIPELIRYLDPTIKGIHYQPEKKRYHIVFLEGMTIDCEGKDLQYYLSSGTMKGISIFMRVFELLKNGGYLLIDEIENHFNREIVASIIRLFAHPDINVGNAVLIFSTHYVELLDYVRRSDSIYLLQNTRGISVRNLSEDLKRNDLKKSEILKSATIPGTAPSYEHYHELMWKLMKTNENLEVG